LTLLETNILQLKNLPFAILASSPHIVFEIQRVNETQWHELQSGSINAFSGTARVAGRFNVRARLTVKGIEVKIPKDHETIEVQFPDYNQILAGSGVQTRMDQAWQDTLNATTMTNKREEGYFITLDTSGKGTWSITGHTIQNPPATNVFYKDANGVFKPAVRPKLDLKYLASDIPTDPSAIEPGVTYVVGWFHTHTPMAYTRFGSPTVIIGSRRVGPSGTPNQSGKDYGFSYTNQLPGFVYDYVEAAPKSGSIPFGHPLNSSAKIYDIVPAYRRPTP